MGACSDIRIIRLEIDVKAAAAFLFGATPPSTVHAGSIVFSYPNANTILSFGLTLELTNIFQAAIDTRVMMMFLCWRVVVATLTLGWATSSVSADVGDKNKSGTRGGGGTDAITMLSSTEIDAFQEIVRNHHDRPLDSIPVSEGGTTFGSVDIADRMEEWLVDTVSCGGHRYVTR